MSFVSGRARLTRARWLQVLTLGMLALAAVLVLSVLVAIGLIVVLGKFLRALLRRASGWLRGSQPSV